MSNPYREPGIIQEPIVCIENEHMLLPPWSAGNYYVIETAQKNISEVKVWQYHSKQEIKVVSVSERAGLITVYIPHFCESVLSISYKSIMVHSFNGLGRLSDKQ